MIFLWAKRLLLGVALLAMAFAAVIVATTHPEPLTPTEIARLTIGLNEAAAIGVPHDYLMRAEMRISNRALLLKVEAGLQLDTAESRAYRKIYQAVLQENQKFLGSFDAELTVLPDYAMQIDNNIESQGIAGRHDHHDVSARRNFASLLHALAALEQSSTSIGRIRNANLAQKELVDLISHLGVAPHTISVPYQVPDVPWPDQLMGAEFEKMVRAFKAAQFVDVHSQAYWADIDDALAAYTTLILAVQERIMARTSRWERRFAGRFLSLQTLPPPVDLNRPLRRK
jgi:hypothetical protein